MKFIVAPILIILIMTQVFSKWIVIVEFSMSRNYITKNLCENRYRPKMHCDGNCVLMKKMKKEEKQEQNAPGSFKTGISSVVLSSRSFFATIEHTVSLSSKSYLPVLNTGKPIDRTFPVFHPPVV